MPTQMQNQRPERETREAPVLTMRALVEPSSFNAEARTVDVTWSTGAEVARRDWWTGDRYTESLSMDPAHIRMDRLNSGAPVLDSHNAYSTRSVLASVVPGTAKSDGKQGSATIKFSRRPEAETVMQDVRDGILRNLSVGYVVHRYDVQKAEKGKVERRTAVDWEPHEISIVPIPADAGAQVRAFDDELSARGAGEGATMTDEEKKAAAEAEAKRKSEEAQRRAAEEAERSRRTTEEDAQRRAVEEARALERKRIGGIDELCRLHGVAAEQRSKWVDEGVGLEAVRSAILDQITERQRASSISSVGGVSVGNRDRDKAMQRDAVDCLLRRAGVAVEGEGHRSFGDGFLMDVARRFLESGGVNTGTMSRLDIAKRALSTSDFAGALYLVGEKTMRLGYGSVPLVHRTVLKKGTASDFRPKNTVAVDAGDTLDEVPESGVIPQKPARFEVGSYSVKSYGKIVAFTRKMLIDDDIDALTGVSMARGRAAAETERKLVWAFILGNPNAPDGNTVFHLTKHLNFPNAAATTVSTGDLDTANSFFRTAPSLSGTPINASMRYIVAADAADRALDRLLYGGYLPQAASTGVTERDRQISVLCEPMVASAAGKQDWLGFADPIQASSFEYAYLAGTTDGVRLEQQMGFEVEGLQLKVCLDFGIGCSDWRGVYYKRQA